MLCVHLLPHQPASSPLSSLFFFSFPSSLPHPLLFPFWEVVFVEKLQRFRTNRPQEQKEAEAITIQLLSSTFLSCFSIFLSSSPLPPFFIHSPFCLPDCPQERRLNNVGQAEKSLCFHVPALVIAMCSPFAHTPHFTVTHSPVCAINYLCLQPRSAPKKSMSEPKKLRPPSPDADSCERAWLALSFLLLSSLSTVSCSDPMSLCLHFHFHFVSSPLSLVPLFLSHPPPSFPPLSLPSTQPNSTQPMAELSSMHAPRSLWRSPASWCACTSLRRP